MNKVDWALRGMRTFMTKKENDRKLGNICVI